jgi:hypothetical protein
MTSVSDDQLSIVFSGQGTGGSPTGPDPESRVGDQENESPGRPVSCGMQVSGEAGIVVKEQDPLGERFAAFFL